MRENFGEKLIAYNEDIKEHNKDFSSGKETKEKAIERRDSLLKQESGKYYGNEEEKLKNEEYIYRLQKEKLEKLKKFKKFLESTRKEGGFSFGLRENKNPKVRKVSFKNDKFFVGNEKVSLSEIMTDKEWGIEYTFDESVNIHDIRKYYLDEIKSTLGESLDKQIISQETANGLIDTGKKSAYLKIEENMNTQSKQEGIVAEKMVKNFLKKLSIDNSSLFEIIDSDVYQDVEQKIDFIIHTKGDNKKNRGVGVSENEKLIGIQFTINESATKHKEDQINKVKKNRMDRSLDDIILITMPKSKASELYKTWLENKKSGGPDKLWDKETKETLFKNIMNNILPQSQIDDFCIKNF